jgi:hypothetical protein
MFNCQICENSFNTLSGLYQHVRKNHDAEKYYNDYINTDTSKNKCKTCGRPVKFKNIARGYLSYCSIQCSANNPEVKRKRNATTTERYGSATYNNPRKAKSTKKKKYGSEDAFCFNSSQMKNILKTKYGNENYNNPEQMKETKIKKYGYYFNNKNKAKNTCMLKYNTNNAAKNSDVKIRAANTNIEKYGFISPSNNDIVKQKQKISRYKTTYTNLNKLSEYVTPLFNINEYDGIKNEYKFKCTNCNAEFYSNLMNGRIPRCLICHPHTCESIQQNNIIEFLNDLNIKNIEKNNRNIISPLELDIYLPEKNIAIEYNGIYWHSELAGDKDKNYHLNKTDECEEKGIQLIHIFETEWLYKKEIIQSVLKSKLNIYDNILYARNCIIKEINSKISNNFLNANHLQGADKSKYRLGLFYKNELVTTITFGKSRFDKNYEWEIYRICSKLNTKVIGGISKLLKHFIKLKSPKSVVTYADRRFSVGHVYKTIGFNFVKNTSPNYFYTKGYDLYSRHQFQKHKLKNILKEYDENLTEWQNMQLNGYDRVWDCGNIKYQLVL